MAMLRGNHKVLAVWVAAASLETDWYAANADHAQHRSCCILHQILTCKDNAGKNGDPAEGCLTQLPPCLLQRLRLGHPQSTAAAVELISACRSDCMNPEDPCCPQIAMTQVS